MSSRGVFFGRIDDPRFQKKIKKIKKNTWLASDYWQPGALLVFTGNLGLLFPKKSVMSVGIDSV